MELVHVFSPQLVYEKGICMLLLILALSYVIAGVFCMVDCFRRHGEKSALAFTLWPLYAILELIPNLAVSIVDFWCRSLQWLTSTPENRSLSRQIKNLEKISRKTETAVSEKQMLLDRYKDLSRKVTELQDKEQKVSAAVRAIEHSLKDKDPNEY